MSRSGDSPGCLVSTILDKYYQKWQRQSGVSACCNDLRRSSITNWAGRMSRQRCELELQNFTWTSGRKPVMTSLALAASDLLQDVIEYCIKVFKQIQPAELNNSAMVWRKITQHNDTECLQRFSSRMARVRLVPTKWWTSVCTQGHWISLLNKLLHPILLIRLWIVFEHNFSQLLFMNVWTMDKCR